MIEPNINERMARFAPSQTPDDVDPIASDIASRSAVATSQPTMEMPDIDPIARQIAENDRESLNAAVLGARTVNPDEAARAIQVGRKVGVPAEVARADMQRAEQQAYLSDLRSMDFLRTDPVMANFLANKQFAETAHDDIGVLSKLQPLVFEAAMLQTQGGFFRVVGAGYERGATTAELGGIGTKGLFGFAEPGDFERAKELTKRMQALGQPGLVGSAAEMIAQNVGQLRTIGTTTVAGAALGSLAGPAGLVAGGALGATAGVVIGTGTMEAGNLYLSMREEGVSDDAAIPAAIAGGFLNGLIEVVGMKIAAAPFKALASKVIREEVSKAIAQPTMRSALIAAGKAYGLQVGGEGFEEGLQEIVAIASEEIAKAADGIDSETSLRDATGRVIEAFAYGGMASALLGGIGPGANLVVDLRRASATQRQQEFFNGLAENRKESKLAQRNPQGYERFLAAQAQDTPAETIYVDAATARDVLAQSGTTTAQLEELLPGIRERLEQAVETGGDVTIPTSQFGARLANTELGNALLPHMRLSPDAMSATEAQAFEAERQAVVEEARTILAAKQEADAAFVAEAQQVEDEAFEQVRAVGQFTDIEARTIAKLRQAMVVVDAAEAGMTPAQYQRERGVPLQVRGEGMAVPVAPSQAVAPLTANETNPLQTALGELSARIEEQNAKVANEKLESSNPIAKAVAGIKDSVRRLNNAINANDEVEIAHQAWRLRNRLDNHRQNLDANTLAAVEGMLAKLDAFMQQRGIEIHNPIGEKYVDGWHEVDVVAWEEVDERNQEPETIKQTIRPIIRRNGQVASKGQVIATYATEADLKRHEEKQAQREAEMRAKLEAKFAPGETSAAQQAGGTLEQAAISRMDADYLAAVERGDMEAAQRMVDEAAKAAGYWRRNNFQRKWAFKKVGITPREIESAGIPLDKQTERQYEAWNQVDAGMFDGLQETLVRDGDIRVFESRARGMIWRRYQFVANGNPAGFLITSSPVDVAESIEKNGLGNQNYIFAKYTAPEYRKQGISTTLVEAALEDLGYLNADYMRTPEAQGVYGRYLERGFIKSADPVTYDEQGNIVPLSRRFDITSPKLFEQAAVVPATIDAASNVESSFAFAGTQTFRNNRQFKKAIQDRVNSAAKDAGIDLTQFTPDVEQYLVRVAVADAITALRTNPNAVGWYNEKVTKALRLVSLVHPEIDTDPRAKFAFTWALAVTSNGLKVDKNFELAERAYAEYKRTGKMPTNVGAGTAQIAINESLGLFNELVEKYGIDEVEKFMTSKTTVKEVIAYTNKNVSGENLTTEVYGAAALGPKIGNGFFANLYGHFEQLTMDRWLMRTWGRWTGTLLEDNERNILLKREQLAGLIKAMPAKNRKQLEAIVGMSLATDDVDSLSAAINKASMKKENRLEMAKIGIADEKAQAKFTKIIGEPTRGVQRISYGDEFRKLGNSLSKYLDGQKEAPSGPPERARIRKVFAQALAELQTQFPSLTMSDLQALLWYPEKRLYDAAKTADEGQTGYEDNAAPDYANSAAKLALAKGISQDVINSTIGEVDAELAAISAERTTGAERGIGNLVLRQDSRLAGAGFEQAARGPARGGFDPRTLNVLVGKGGDVSTLAHELIHLRVAEYIRMARSATPPARVMDDLDTLFVFMGVEGATPQERLDNYERMTIEQRRPLEEKATYNFEIYLYEGKAPSVELRGVFDRLAAWMRRVYKSIRDDLNAIYRREFGTDLPILTPEVRSVFDRMLASEEQIKRQEAISGMKGLFQTQAESGMGDAEWAAYQAMQQEATDAAVTDLNTASMRQLQWLGNARARILRDLQKKHEAKRKEVTAEVAAAVKVEPVYRAMTYLRYGRFVDTDGSEVEVEGTHRLDIEKVRAMYAGMPSAESVEPIRATGMAVPANVRPDITPLGTGKYGMLGKDGLDPDVVADMFGYSSGDEMVRALLAAKPMKEAVVERTDAEMLRRFGDMNTPAALETEVQKALHNEARARMVAVQLRFVSKAQTPVRVMLEAAKQVAADMISDTTIRNLRPNDFVAAEARAARDSEYLVKYEAQPRIRGRAEYDRVRLAALAAGSTEEDASIAATAAQEAFIAAQTEARSQEFRERFGPTTPQEALIRAQRAQLYQNQLAAEALRVKEYVDKQVKYLRRVLRDENVKRMGADATDQVRSILDNYSLVSMTRAQREQVTDLRNWLAAEEANGMMVDIDPSLADSARRRNYTELTVSQFRDLVESVKLIEYRGKNERNIYLAGQKAVFEEKRDEIVASTTEVAEKKGRKVSKDLGDEDRKWMNSIASYDASQQTIGNIVYVLDGGKRDGPLAKYLLIPSNDAGNQEATDRAAVSEKVNDIVGPLAKKGQFVAPKMYFPNINESLSLEQRMVVALNYGNQSNIDRLLNGEQWTEEQARVIIESLTEEQLQAVQSIWDVMSSFRDRVAEKSRRLTGKEPRWLEPLPMRVTSADGNIVELRGGYYPAKYNPRRSVGARELDIAGDAERLQREAYTATTTSRSFEKNRSDKPPVDQVLSRQFVAMYSGLNEVIHDLAWHDFAISATRLLRDKSFQRVIKERYGLETYNAIKDWVDVVVAGDRTKYDSFEQVAIFARQNVSVAAMGIRLMTAAVQPTGIFPAMTRTGVGPMVRAIAEFAYSPVETSRNVVSRSSFMENRGRTRFRDLNEIQNIVQEQSRLQGIRRTYISSAYVLTSFMQGLVDTSVWMAAYSNAINAGKSEKDAVFVADQTVIDTQGSGRVQDLSSAMRGGKKQSAYAKLFTPFYQYSNTMYSLFGAQMRTAPSYGKAAKDAFLILTVGAIVEELIRYALRPSPEDEEPEDLIKKLAANQIDFVVGLPFGIREFRGAGSLIVGTEDGVQSYRGPSGLRIVTDATQAAVQARQGEFDAAFRRSMINLLGTTVGIPSAQINSTIDGIEALSEGEVEGPSAVLAPLTGVKR